MFVLSDIRTIAVPMISDDFVEVLYDYCANSLSVLSVNPNILLCARTRFNSRTDVIKEKQRGSRACGKVTA